MQDGKEQATKLVTTNLEKIFDINTDGDFVAYCGGDMFDIQSKVVAILSARRGEVALL